MTDQDQLSEPFARNRDDAHPVRWSPADGDTPAYLTLKGALERLAGYYIDPAITEHAILTGAPLRTPFAFYQLAGIPVTAEPGSLAGRLLELDDDSEAEKQADADRADALDARTIDLYR